MNFSQRRHDRFHQTVRDSFLLHSRNVGRRVVSGASFTFLGIALRTMLTLGSVSILARLLSPADFGYVAMATVVTEFAALFGGFGFSNLLIQRPIATRIQMDTVFWASALVGAVLTATVFALSFAAEMLFADPWTGNVLRVLCFTFLINGLCPVHEAIIARLMRFRTEFWIQVVTVAVRGSTAVVFALLGFGVWSLVAGSIMGSLTAVTLNVLAVGYVPRFRFHLAYLTSTWTISSSYFGSGLLYYATMNLDLMLIGRQLGAAVLGHYQNARSLTDEVRGRLAMPLQRVLFPAFAALQSENERLQASVMRAGRLLAAVIFPVGMGLSAVADELVPVLYGSKWGEMIPVLSMLGMSAAIRGSTAIASPIFNSKNRVALALKYNVLGTVLMIIAVSVSLPYGIRVVSASIAVASLYSLVTFRAGLGLIGLKTAHALQILGYPAIASTAMCMTVSALRTVARELTHNEFVLLPIHVLGGALIYALTLHLLSRQYFQDIRELAGKIMTRK